MISTLKLLILISFAITSLVKESNAERDIEFFFSPVEVESHQSGFDDYFVPASLIKVATAAHSLFTFGENHQFSTELFLTEKNELVFVGYGDPDLTSEKLRSCLYLNLKGKIKNLQNIVLDTSKFDNSFDIPGRGLSLNPYDARVSALPINYNSVALKKSKSLIESGELETPLTGFAKSLAGALAIGTHRIGIVGVGGAERQFAELAEKFLLELGIPVNGNYLIKPKPDNSKSLGRCSSSPLKDILYSMLKYSNNFTANQVFLSTGANFYGYPANLIKSRNSMNKFLMEEVGIEGDFRIDEGAGLSRDTKLSPRQLMKILQYFRAYKHLLPESKGLFYKSGTLTGVSNLAGYYTDGGNVKSYFALFSKRQMTIPERIDYVTNKLSKSN